MRATRIVRATEQSRVLAGEARQDAEAWVGGAGSGVEASTEMESLLIESRECALLLLHPASTSKGTFPLPKNSVMGGHVPLKGTGVGDPQRAKDLSSHFRGSFVQFSLGFVAGGTGAHTVLQGPVKAAMPIRVQYTSVEQHNTQLVVYCCRTVQWYSQLTSLDMHGSGTQTVLLGTV